MNHIQSSDILLNWNKLEKQIFIMTFSKDVPAFIIRVMKSSSLPGSLRIIEDEVKLIKDFISTHRSFLLLLLYLLLLVLDLL